MKRLTDNKFAVVIQAGFDLLPPGVLARLRYTHFFTGTDPVFAGLFDYSISKDGRSYRDTWCVAYPHHQKQTQAQTTIVMPSFESGYPSPLLPALVVHELGHVLDEQLDFEHIAVPITTYAAKDRREAFADAFAAWLFPMYGEYYPMLSPIDEGTLALFGQLETP